MEELSIFIDESGDFGEYEQHSPYYIITMVFHDQAIPISEAVARLDRELDYIGLERHCIHTGPIIRKEENYTLMTVGATAKDFVTKCLPSSDRWIFGTNVSRLKRSIFKMV